MYLSLETEGDLEAYVQERLKADLAGYEFAPRTTKLTDPQGKWRVSSGMQKAIRRGNVDVALTMVHGLYGLDPDYVWRRLNTIVIEEVGVGDIGLCARFLWVSTKKVWRVNNGGDLAYLYLLVEQMCRAHKDRMACDLPCWGILDPRLSDQRASYPLMPVAQLQSIAANPAQGFTDRMVALLALGHLPEDAPRGPKMKKFEDALAAMTHLPYVVRYVALAGRKKQHELQPFGFPFVWEMLTAGGGNAVIVPDVLTDLPMIGRYPSETFDRHNMDGKKAISYFWKACEPVREVFMRFAPTEAKGIDNLGCVLFRVEGQQVDRRLHYPGMMEAWAEAERADMEHSGVPAEHQVDCLQVVQANLPLLHYARCRVFAPQAFSGDKPQPVTLDEFREQNA